MKVSHLNIFPAFTGFVLLMVLPLGACKQEVVEKEPPIRPVKAIKVENTSMGSSRFFSGRAMATQEIDLSFRVPGTLTELPVKVGDTLEQGELVAQLDPDTFRAAVERAEARLARTRATLENATAQRERDKILFDKGHIAQARLDKTTAKESEAKADVRAAKAELEQTQLDLTYTTLKAPFTGKVVTTYADNFQDIQAQEPIVRLLDSSRIEMIVNIPENMIAQVPSVKDVVVEFDPYPGREFPAEIKEIGAEASATTRTYPVTLILDQPEDVEILPGMAGKARRSSAGQQNEDQKRIVVPLAATFSPSEDQGTFVWIFDESSQKVSRRPVDLGDLTADGVLIKDGVESGEWVVVAGVSYLRDDQQVRLLQE
ncbi:MAG: efflux RND transporter periplasmic adaptor subunit [Kiloniellales bacterium]|nr:efflux RND transporter periplasmic adaptor subunit [Kiloniellales bacterium]